MTGVPVRATTSRAGPVALLSASSASLLAVFWWTEIADLPPGRLDEVALIRLRDLVLAYPAAVGPLRSVMSGITFLGAFPTLCVVVLCVAALLARTGAAREALTLVVGSGTGIGAANVLKRIVDRPRPTVVEHWTSFSSSSFPSGHTADSTVVYLLMAAVAARLVRTARLRRPLLACLFCLPILVGFSRMFLGVHWPTDVFGGWALGAAWALLAERLGSKPSRTSNG